MLDSVDASSSMRGPGLLLACKFGSEDAAVREVQRALRELHGKPRIQKATSAASLDSDKSDDTAAKGEGRHRSIEEHARRVAVAHKGLAWLRYDGFGARDGAVPIDEPTPEGQLPGKFSIDAAAGDTVEAFAALVGRRDVPAAALKSCQHIFPVSSCCTAEASALEAAVAAECEAAMANDETKNPLGEKICRVAVAVHTRGDDSRAASANGAPPLARVPARDAALRAIMDARERANLPPVTLDLHNPDVVLVVTQWRVPLTDAGLDGPNEPICGVSLMPGELCDVRAKAITPCRPSAHKRPSPVAPAAAEKKKKVEQWKSGDRSATLSKADKVYDADFNDHRPRGEVPTETLTEHEALSLFDAAVRKRVRSGLLAGEEAGADDANLVDANLVDHARLVHAASTKGAALRLVHGTGDGFDGVTVDLLGPAILVEQHRRWAACVDPLLKAVSTRLGKDTPVYLKRRWSRAPGERGGCLVSGVRVKDDVDGVLADAARRAADEAAAKEGKDTHGDRVVVREPGQFGLKYGLWLTGEEHVGVFLDSRPARELVRSVSAGKRILNLFSYTGGFGAAASVGGAACSHNVDSKAPCLAAARVNYALNGLRTDGDWRAFQKKDVIRFLVMTAKKGDTRYDLVVVDPPPRFSRNSDWAFEAERHTGQLLAMCVEVCGDTNASILIGINALTVSDERFKEMIVEAEGLSGRALVAKRWVGAGEDFPACPYRPTARFVLLEVGDVPAGGVVNGKKKTTIAEELGMRDEGGSDEDASDGGFETANDDDDVDETDGGGADPTQKTTQNDAAFACQMCAYAFSSRNKLFRHYNDENAECGAWCASHGGLAAAAALVKAGELTSPTFDPPDFESAAEAVKKSRAERRKKERQNRESSRPNEASDCELWVGGVHGEHAYARAMKALVHTAIPGSAGIDQPVIRMVVRKGWREKGTGRWIGYGFVRFRDAAEAKSALRHIDGASPVDGVTLTANFAAAPRGGGKDTRKDIHAHIALLTRVKSDSAFESSADGSAYGSACDADSDGDGAAALSDDEHDDDEIDGSRRRLAPGEDPSEVTIARAWPKKTLASRAKALGIASVDSYLAAVADASHRKHADLTRRTVRRVAGAPVPPALLADMRHALDAARWPPVSHRRKVDSERYLVVRREVLGEGKNGEKNGSQAGDDRVVDPYVDLKRAADAVMRWADPTFAYDHLAITRNFVGSPHVDREDKSHQYAVSLGNWGGVGGELVVESRDGSTRFVVDTRDRIGRVDGRCAHWVRGFDAGADGSGAVRYSVIYYVNRPRHGTAETFAVDEKWSPVSSGTRRLGVADSVAIQPPGPPAGGDDAWTLGYVLRSVEETVNSLWRVAGSMLPWSPAVGNAWETFAYVLPSKNRWWLVNLG